MIATGKYHAPPDIESLVCIQAPEGFDCNPRGMRHKGALEGPDQKRRNRSFQGRILTRNLCRWCQHSSSSKGRKQRTRYRLTSIHSNLGQRKSVRKFFFKIMPRKKTFVDPMELAPKGHSRHFSLLAGTEAFDTFDRAAVHAIWKVRKGCTQYSHSTCSKRPRIGPGKKLVAANGGAADIEI